jgi:hypothetical protein
MFQGSPNISNTSKGRDAAMGIANTKTSIPREMMKRRSKVSFENASRFDSWKDIAHYLKRNVRTVQRWEALEAMPVHRHGHVGGASVYGYKDELDAWRVRRSSQKNPIRLTLRKQPIEGQPDALRLALQALLEALHEQLAEEMSRSMTFLTTDNTIHRRKILGGSWL